MYSGSGRHEAERDSGQPRGAKPRVVDAQLAADGHRRPPNLRRRPRRRHHQPRAKDPPAPAAADLNMIGLDKLLASIAYLGLNCCNFSTEKQLIFQ